MKFQQTVLQTCYFSLHAEANSERKKVGREKWYVAYVSP